MTVLTSEGQVYLFLKGWQIPVGEVLEIAFARERELHEEEIRLLEASLSKSWDAEQQLLARIKELEAKVSLAVIEIKRLKGK
jgi:hypothetical protein